MASPLIQFREVYKSFGATHVLRGIDLDIYPGEITVIIGKSGEGKSVLLKHVIGLLRPDSGQIMVEGRDLWRTGKKERKAILRKFGYLFQGTALFDSMTVYENVSLPLWSGAPARGRGPPAGAEGHGTPDLHEVTPSTPPSSPAACRSGWPWPGPVTGPEILLFDDPPPARTPSARPRSSR